MGKIPGYKRKFNCKDYGEQTLCHCKNCRCFGRVSIPCSNEFLICDICLLGKCSPRKNTPRIDYIKIASNNKKSLEEAMQTL